MPKSLFDFANEEKPKPKKEVNAEPRKTQGSQKNIDETTVKNRINDLSKLSQGELMNELFKEVGKQKASGNYNPNQLASQLESIKSMLTPQQLSTLEALLQKIK